MYQDSVFVQTCVLSTTMSAKCNYFITERLGPHPHQIGLFQLVILVTSRYYVQGPSYLLFLRDASQFKLQQNPCNISLVQLQTGAVASINFFVQYYSNRVCCHATPTPLLSPSFT